MRQLVLLILSGKQRVPRKQLSNYAPKRPHIDRGCVRDAQYDLRCSVESALNIGINLVGGQAATAEVYYFKRLGLGIAQ